MYTRKTGLRLRGWKMGQNRRESRGREAQEEVAPLVRGSRAQN